MSPPPPPHAVFLRYPSNSLTDQSHCASTTSASAEILCPPCDDTECPPSWDTECPPSGDYDCPPSGDNEGPPSCDNECLPSEDTKCPPSKDNECPPTEDSECPPSEDSEWPPSEDSWVSTQWRHWVSTQLWQWVAWQALEWVPTSSGTVQFIGHRREWELADCLHERGGTITAPHKCDTCVLLGICERWRRDGGEHIVCAVKVDPREGHETFGDLRYLNC